MLRFHTQTGGVTLTAQQPLLNVARTALEAMSAVLGGTQSLHTNAYDEALGLPTQLAAEVALRTQQVIGYESGVAAVADPLGGSHYVEELTDRVEADALGIMAEVERLGGAVAAIESGWMQRRIAESAYRLQQRVESGERVVVGLNRLTESAEEPVEVTRIEARGEEEQARRVREVRAGRDAGSAAAALERLEEEARGTGNLLPPLREALAAYCTIGECCDRLRAVFGEYRPAAEA